MPDNYEIHESVHPQALYRQVKSYVLERIHSGQWVPDSRITSEKDLTNLLGVSRMTVNRALRELKDEGYLVRLQGVGTFVAPLKTQSALFEVKNIGDEIKERGGIHHCDIILLKEEAASQNVAVGLDVPLGSRVFYSIILHRDRGKTVQLADRYVNPRLAPKFLLQDFQVITPSEYLFSVAPLTEAEHFIEAVIPDSRISELLEIQPGEACLVLHRRTWSRGLVATLCELRYPGCRFRLGGRFRPNQSFNLIA